MAKSSLSNLRQRLPAAAAAKFLTLPQAQARTRQFPRDPHGWKQLGQLLRNEEKFEQAREALEKAAELGRDDHETWTLLGVVAAKSNDDTVARQHFEHALTLDPAAAGAHVGMADLLYRRTEDDAALVHADLALAQKPNDPAALSRKAQLLTRLSRFAEAAVICEQLIKQDPRNALTHWNDLGNINRDLGRLEQAEVCYSKAAAASRTDPIPLSNRLTLLHYMPERSAQEILAATREWSARFAPPQAVERPVPSDRSPSRKIRLGMFSDGFRQHPVGAMTTPALEHLVKLGVEIYAYTTSTVVDSVTKRLMAVAARWTHITNVSNEDLAQRIRDDGIDILMDLSGHNAGNRIRTMTLQPAPVLVKWVGGLINTTGVEAIDYLLSDSIESPPGSDELYTEKLIRMPDDYICYMPPRRVPDVGPLPALKNGYVTFGCFNNPTKINEIVLEQWAGLMHAVPESRLFLKGGAFGSPELHERTLAILDRHGIAPARVRIEGHSPHYELFQRYNDVDVALDPWPYSGGLTTCEAMLMGVPVVTMPGPTFAGRHSATHLANAGMPELVAQDWNQYRERAQELAANVETLSTIRGHLRQILLQSPVCDGPRFARNLANALRAIWQRYCEGKAPAALAFDQDGSPWFEDDDAPMVLAHPQGGNEDAGLFNFAFKGKIVALDHGGSYIDSDKFLGLSQLRSLTTIAIDPAGNIKQSEYLKRQNHLQHYHGSIALGDGQPAVLTACLDASLTGTLEPLPVELQLPFARQGASVLARIPMQTVRLNDVEGLEKVDWLILDDRHDTLKILQSATRLLAGMLLVQAKVLFAPIFRNQPDLAGITNLLGEHGFRLLRLDEAKYLSYFPQAESLDKDYGGSQLMAANAVFVPGEARLKTLDDNQRRKLAFLLYSAYGAPDFAHRLLTVVDADMAQRFLLADGWKESGKTAPPPGAGTAQPPAPIELRDIVRTTAVTVRSRLARQRAYVGVPIYNEEKYIEETIRSLKAQDAEGVGFLIADNASTDRTVEIVRDIAGSDARFEIHSHQSNHGAAFNFTFALEATDSDYFMWLGGHDYLSPDYLSRMIERLDTDRSVSMAFGMPHSTMNGKTAFLGGAVYDFSSAVPAQRYADSAARLANCTIIHSLFRREHVQDFPIRETISGDHVLISHLLWKGMLAYVDGPKYFRRYFEARKDTADERITGKRDQKLSRTDFYNYYRDDLAGLAGDTLGPEVLDKLQADLGAVLRKRFG